MAPSFSTRTGVSKELALSQFLFYANQIIPYANQLYVIARQLLMIKQRVFCCFVRPGAFNVRIDDANCVDPESS